MTRSGAYLRMRTHHLLIYRTIRYLQPSISYYMTLHAAEATAEVLAELAEWLLKLVSLFVSLPV